MPTHNKHTHNKHFENVLIWGKEGFWKTKKPVFFKSKNFFSKVISKKSNSNTVGVGYYGTEDYGTVVP